MAQTRILVVDDEKATLRLCAVILNSLPDVEITLESDSCRAAERLVSEHFDLLITDIRMPIIDGMELLLMARQHNPHLSVLVITGFPTVNTAVESMKRGATDYIVKPFLPDDFRATVRRLLEERHLREAPGAEGTDEEGAAQQSTRENALEHQVFIEVETRYRTLFEGVP
ncbi:MAG: response regulator, partial [Candidatus Latescibacteria bacterium]|nr:response regulator [Candidatus Latescibacterota bacterium]